MLCIVLGQEVGATDGQMLGRIVGWLLGLEEGSTDGALLVRIVG